MAKLKMKFRHTIRFHKTKRVKKSRLKNNKKIATFLPKKSEMEREYQKHFKAWGQRKGVFMPPLFTNI